MIDDSSPVPFDALPSVDLEVGRLYRGGPQPHVGADPLHRLTGVGNTGGFRMKTVKSTGAPALCVLFSTGAVSEWPDGWACDGAYVYYGDQREPGKDVLDTPRKGNRLLAHVDALVRRGAEGRAVVPPFLLFHKAGTGRDVRFEGLLVPAGEGWLTVQERSGPEGVFTNFRARFARLAVAEVPRLWLSDVIDGSAQSASAPDPWSRWVRTGEVA